MPRKYPLTSHEEKHAKRRQRASLADAILQLIHSPDPHAAVREDWGEATDAEIDSVIRELADDGAIRSTRLGWMVKGAAQN